MDASPPPQGLRYRNEAHRPSFTPPAGFPGDPLASAWGEGTGVPSGSPGVTPSPGPRAGAASTLPGGGDAPTRAQLLLHGLLSVGVQWGFARLRRHGLVHGWGMAEPVSAARLAEGTC